MRSSRWCGRCWSRAVLGVVVALGASCRERDEGAEPPALVRLSPQAISTTGTLAVGDAWQLFDRSVHEGLAAPSAGTVEVSLPNAGEVAAVKVYGPAPYRLSVVRRGGASLGLDGIDLASLDAGWHTFAASEPGAIDAVELRLESHGSTGQLAEIELWAEAEPGGARTASPDQASALAGGDALPPPMIASTARPDEVALAAPDRRCASFTVDLARRPVLFRRAYLVFQTEGLFRPFSVRRQVNGAAEQGGTWLAPGAEPRQVVDEIDPAALRAGGNQISFCLPEGAAGGATLSSLRVVGELDRGIDQVTAVVIGTDGRDGAALLDGDAETTATVAAGERIVLHFDRRIAPDAVAWSGAASADEAIVECIDEAGRAASLATESFAIDAGSVLTIDGGEQACASLALTFPAATTLAEVDVAGSGAGERVDWPRIVVSSEREHFGSVAWVGGFTARPATMTGPIRVAVDGAPVESMTGDFGRLVERDGDSEAPWPVTIAATLTDGGQRTARVVLVGDGRDDLAAARAGADDIGPDGTEPVADDPRFGGEGEAVAARVTPDKAASIRLGSAVGVDLPVGSVREPANITVRHLGTDVLPPLDPGLVNVTAPEGHGYEFLPHGMTFRRKVEVLLPFDPQLIPEGKTAADVRAYFYDTRLERWVPLERAALDVGTYTTKSLTSHFTIMINAVLTVPENKGPLAFDPTTLSSVAAASPAAEIDLIEPPEVSSTGDAIVSLPLRLPRGRGAYTPDLGLRYSSSAGNSWLGVGWDLAISRVEIDSRFGVPSYSADEEPRYLLDGAALVPTGETEGPRCLSGADGRRYRARIETSFSHILRCGTGPARYHFELRDRSGTLFVYGDDAASGTGNQAANASLRSYVPGQGVFAWHLREVVDTDGNTTRFRYQVDEDAGSPSREPFRAVYLSSIEYTSHPAASQAPYRVELVLDDGSRPDWIVSGRAGFKVATRKLLRRVRVRAQGDVVREYVLTYQHGQFAKSRLASVRVYGTDGCAAGADAFVRPACGQTGLFHEHTFAYHEEEAQFAPPVAWTVDGDPDPEAAALTKGQTESKRATVSFGVQAGPVGIGGSASRESGDREELVGLYDLNGDGLTDQLLRRDDSLHALYNQFRAGRATTDALLAPIGPGLDGLGELGHEKHGTWSGGLVASLDVGAVSASASGGMSNSTARADRFLTDIDGDGFVDLVRADGTVLLGRPCPTGMCFTEAPYGATGAIAAEDDPLLQGYQDEIGERLFLGDPVVQWVAPFTGRVRLDSTARKLRAGGDDGVVVQLYHQDGLLRSASIAATRTTPVVLASGLDLDVVAGDAVYFRVRTGTDEGIEDDVLNDEVEAHFTATYERVCDDGPCFDVIDPLEAREPTGRPVFVFDSRDDFRLAGTPAPFAVPAHGTLELQAVLQKQVTTADLRVCLQRFPAPTSAERPDIDVPCDGTGFSNLTGTVELGAGEVTATSLVRSIPVATGQVIVLRVESDLSFDPHHVSLAPATTGVPILAYSSVCPPDDDGNVGSCTTNPAVLAKLPVLASQFGPTVPLVDRHPHNPRVPYIARESGTLLVFPPSPPGPYLFAIRSDRQGLIRQDDCRLTSCGTAFHAISVTAGESITFELLTASASYPDSILVIEDDVFGEWRFAPLHVRALVPPPPPPTPFAGGYRGFGAALWNEKIDFEPTAILADFEQLDDLEDERLLEIAHSIATPPPNPGGANFTGGEPAWIGSSSLAFVSSSTLHAAMVGAAVQTGDGPTADWVDVFSGGGYVRLSGTRSYYLGAGVKLFRVAGVSLAVSFSDTNTTTDLVDMNGDGVADVVAVDSAVFGALTSSASGAGNATFDVDGSLRKRKGIDYSIDFNGDAPVRPKTTSGGRTLSMESDKKPDQGTFGLSAGVGLGLGRSQTHEDLLDVNGDGLLDRVVRDGASVSVALNLGNRFGRLEQFGHIDDDLLVDIDGFEEFERTVRSFFGLDSGIDALQHDTSISKHVTAGVNLGVVDFSASSSSTSTRMTRELADLNGDGLPDLLVKRDGETEIRVQFNRGGDFAPPARWEAHTWTVDGQDIDLAGFIDDRLSDLGISGPDVLAGTGSVTGKSFSASVNIGGFGFGGGISESTDTYELSLVDIDGDGSVDHVLRRGHDGDPGTIYVKRNQVTGKANLLERVSRPLGGSFTLDYEHTDASVDLPGRRPVLTKVTVSDGVDLGAGFESPDQVTEVEYRDGFHHRGEKQFFGFGTVVARRADGVSATNEYENRTYALHGSLVREVLRDGSGRLFTERRFTHAVRAVAGADGDPVGPHADCLAHLHPLLRADACTATFPVVVREETVRAEGGANAKVHIVRDTEHDRFGNVLVSIDEGDDAIADDRLHIQASYRNDTARWILGLPTALTVRDGSASGAPLRARRGDYDDVGNLVAIHVETGSATATTRLAYDTFGNLERAITPPNARGETQTIDLTYDPVAHSYPIRVRDGFGLESRASYDLRFGVAVEEIDENGQRLVRTLDSFGRLIALRGPYDEGNTAISVDYRHRASPPLAVTVNRPATPPGYDGPVPPAVTTVTAIDGLARTIEVRNTAVVDGVRGMTTSGVVSRDAVGRAVREYHPFFAAGASDDFVPPQTTLATEVSYDALDRAVRTVHPDGAVETVAFAVAPDPDGRRLLLARSIDANGNARETFTDLAEQVRAFVEHPTPAISAIVRYDWTPTSDLARVVDAEGNVTRLSYDLRGLRTELTSRDVGLVEDRFDLMGNRIALVEPNHRALGAEVRFVYERDRLVRIDYPSKPDATFRYGAPGEPHGRAGRIVEVVDEAGRVEKFYGALGEVTRTIRDVDPGQPGRTPVRFDTRFVHDSFGRLLEIGYPDGEVVTNSFDAAGELAAVRGAGRGWTRTYAEHLRYDVFGNRIQVRYGNGAVSRWTFEPARVRLAALTTTLASAERIQDLRYQYDPAGNPTGITTQLPAPGPGDKLPGGSTLAMTYDGVDRLTRATGTSAVAPNKTTAYEQTFAYSPSHNLLRKKRTHIITQPSGIPVAPPHSNIDLAYAYGARPHLATRVGDLEIEYDPSANPVIRRKLDTGMEERLIWDDDGRLVEFIRGGAHQRNRYDAAGLRVIRRGEQGETIFASPYFDLENATRGVKHVFAGSTRVATILGGFGTGAGSGGGKPASDGPPAPPNRPGLAFFFHQDHLGSTTVLTDDRGDVHEHLEYFPDGEVWIERGPQRPVNGYLFSGKPFDPETGFSDFGQRFYDPRTSLFLGIDPKVTEDSGSAVGAPMYLAVSAYAAQSPFRFVDPDGRGPCDYLPCEEAEDLKNKATHAAGKVWEGVREEAEHVVEDPWGTAESVIEGTKDTIELSAEGYAMMYILVAGSEQQREQVRKDKRLDRARASLEQYIQTSDPDDVLKDLGRAAFWYLLGRGTGLKTKRSPPQGCFVAGTLVQTPNGLVPIEELRVGDVVLSRDEHTGRLRSDEVTHTFIRHDVPVVEVVVTTETGESEILETTAEHPFWVEGRGWVKVGDLAPGAQLLVNGRGGATMTAATWTTRVATVYNIEVAGAHTYFVGRLGTWVHNKPMRNKNLRKVKSAGMNWSWKSQPTFGHTFNTHGAGKKNTGKLRGRAGGTGDPQGQWLDNAAAAQWLKEQRPHLSGPANVRLPSHVKAQVIMPNGTIVPATWATLVPHPSGGYRSAIPIRP